MSLEITVGPPLLTINQGHTVMASEPDGQIFDHTDKGLFFFDTRLVSVYRLFANGKPFELLNAGSVFYYAARSVLTNPELETDGGKIPAKTLNLTLSRTVDGGIHEDIDIVNYGADGVRFVLEILVRSDFADLFDVKGEAVVRRGRTVSDWDPDTGTVRTTYENGAFSRSLVLQARNASTAAVYANGRVAFEVELDHGARWHVCFCYTLVDGQQSYGPPDRCFAHDVKDKLGAELRDWQSTVLKFASSNEEFYRLFQQSVEDMASLRLPVEGTSRLHFVPAAGVPWFVTLFGRDSLIAALQCVFVYPDFMRGALDVLGRYQARERDDYRDAEPGKILHEFRHGELARLGRVPHTPYYGTADATPLYLTALHIAWRATGDRALLEQHLETAERCLGWIDDWGDRDGDGFQEYGTRSSAGYENQGWKDAGDAVLYEDGTKVKGPTATCELQGYVYDAWCRMAEVYGVLGRPDDAAKYREKAAQLFDAFDRTFWDEDSGFYAYCLDGEKRKVMTVASNPGHLLFSGIVPRGKAQRVVDRLMTEDMWSGWGIRTLSARHPAYNPFSYQNGSVWPHDNGLIAIGMKRYGLHEEACRVARDISEAASYFMLHQLPELYSGISRDGVNFPVQYAGANVPQAWAAGSCFALLQAMLGFQPHAAEGVLYLDPWLPRWMPDMTLRDLRIGSWCFDLSFARTDEGTDFTVIRGDPGRVQRKPFSDSLQRPGHART